MAGRVNARADCWPEFQAIPREEHCKNAVRLRKAILREKLCKEAVLFQTDPAYALDQMAEQVSEPGSL